MALVQIVYICQGHILPIHMILANVHNLNQSHIKPFASPGEPRDAQGGREGQNAHSCYQASYNSTLLQRNDNTLATAVLTMLSIQLLALNY